MYVLQPSLKSNQSFRGIAEAARFVFRFLKTEQQNVRAQLFHGDFSRPCRRLFKDPGALPSLQNKLFEILRRRAVRKNLWWLVFRLSVARRNHLFARNFRGAQAMRPLDVQRQKEYLRRGASENLFWVSLSPMGNFNDSTNPAFNWADGMSSWKLVTDAIWEASRRERKCQRTRKTRLRPFPGREDPRPGGLHPRLSREEGVEI